MSFRTVSKRCMTTKAIPFLRAARMRVRNCHPRRKKEAEILQGGSIADSAFYDSPHLAAAADDVDGRSEDDRETKHLPRDELMTAYTEVRLTQGAPIG